MQEDIDLLVKEFGDNVGMQAELISKGEAKKGNLAAKRYLEAFERLRAFGEKGRDALKVLFADQRPEVRVMAASFLLRHCEAEARLVLERETATKGLVGFGAAQALQRWEQGTWTLDPE